MGNRTHFQKFMSFFPAPNTFQVFGDKKDLPAMILENPEPQELAKLNVKGYGVFICVNETDGEGRSAKNIKRVRYVFADLDGVSPSKAMDDMPKFAVQSSTGKYHAYWAVDSEFPLEGFKHIQKAIAHKYGSDQSVNDLPRVMRVAGFLHQKSEPCKTEVVWIDKENPRPLSYAECLEKWPPAPIKRWTKKQPTTTTSESFDVGYSITELLERFGWSYYHGNYWARPGKENCVSGSIMESGMFYVFSSETCLKPNTACDAFEVLAQYEYGGDKKRCAKAVIEARK